MEFLVDTANLGQIKELMDYIPLAGVTTNPSIIMKEGRVDFFEQLNNIRNLIGSNRSLHVQVTSLDYEGIIKDSRAILNNLGQETYIKIPVDKEGLKAIKELKKEDINITATAVYTKFQAYLALDLGVDYIAPYYNRMEDLDSNPEELVLSLSKLIDQEKSSTKILGASFKNLTQVTTAFESGAQAVTIAPELFDKAMSNYSVLNAIETFSTDWKSIYGVESSIYTLDK